jgi:3-oxoacyl-[acyl-carrier protein] reductase
VEGADVAVSSFTNPVRDVEQTAGKLGRSVIVVKADVRSTAEVNALVGKTIDRFGKVDIVFSNAGILSWARTEDLTDDEWDFVVDCDLKGTFRLCRAVVPQMKKQKYGRIVFNSSLSGTSTGWVGHAHYCAAKAGLIGLAKSLAVELAREGITVNAVSPGIIETEQSKSKGSLGPEGLRKIGQQIPIGYVGDPEDVASVVTFLVSEEARYLTGQNITVDGGYSIQEDLIPVGNLPPPPGHIQRYDKLLRVD